MLLCCPAAVGWREVYNSWSESCSRIRGKSGVFGLIFDRRLGSLDPASGGPTGFPKISPRFCRKIFSPTLAVNFGGEARRAEYPCLLGSFCFAAMSCLFVLALSFRYSSCGGPGSAACPTPHAAALPGLQRDGGVCQNWANFCRQSLPCNLCHAKVCQATFAMPSLPCNLCPAIFALRSLP